MGDLAQDAVPAAIGRGRALGQDGATFGASDGVAIVVGGERRVTAGLARAAGDRAERVETPREGGRETLLALHVGGDRTDDRRLLLVGAVRAAEPLDRRVGAPAGLEQVMNPLALVLAAEIGVIAAPGAAGIGEDKDALVVIHEGGGLGKIRGGGAGRAAQGIPAPPGATPAT